MGFFQVGFEITRLPKDTNMTTPMFGNMMNDNYMANTNGSAAGIRVGIGSSVFQIASSVISDRFAMACMVSGVYIGATTWLAARLLHSPLAASPTPTVLHYPIVILVGTVVILAFYVACTRTSV